MTTAHVRVEGELNSLAHMLSHVGDILSLMGKHTATSMTAHQAADTIGAHLRDQGIQHYSVSENATDAAVMTITLHSCHGKQPEVRDRTLVIRPKVLQGKGIEAIKNKFSVIWQLQMSK